MKSAGLSCIHKICIRWYFTALMCLPALALFVYCILTLWPLCCSFVCQRVHNFPSVCVFICLLIFLDPFVSGPVGRFLTGVALDELSTDIKRQRERQAVSHYAGPPLLALIESSDPKLMRRGARAHLLSAADVLRRKTGEQRWQCWMRFVSSDNPLHTLTHSVISHSMFAIVLKRYRL